MAKVTAVSIANMDKWQCVHCGTQNLWDIWRCRCGIGIRPEKELLELTEATNPENAPLVEAILQKDVRSQYRREEVGFLMGGSEPVPLEQA